MTAKDSTTAYGAWRQPGTEFTISYSLLLFHEIDFLVNEAYRRIPYGGIEIGGLLFGYPDSGEARIEAFRPIECEHASGPSFVLSERDLAALRAQLSATSADPELQGMMVLGWFISHSRSELRLTDREVSLFQELFPGPGKFTLLIKPERFQATRFAFLVRGADGNIERDGTQQAFILPLPGRSDRNKVGGPVPGITNREPEPPVREHRRDTAIEAGELRIQANSDPPTPVAAKESSVIETRPEISVVEAARAGEALPESDVVKSKTLRPLEEIRKARPRDVQRSEREFGHRESQKGPARFRKHVNFRLAVALLVAAVLGCALGYGAYQLLSPSPIPLAVEARPSSLLVSWPASETQGSDFAALRIDDASAIALTPEEKSKGQAEINVARDNVKIELIVQHRMGDARGIVRFVKAQASASSQNP
ncbi:MAG: hypothetical protein JOY62_03205 [Acidobacteriaceae bacterium]|nr:hypothetical protein [Acidobacteriaceae bacterium]MBV9778958.1 hypothetical protein [Acidobacteriaceae bacterium]